MNENHSLAIIDAVSKAAAPITILDAIQQSLKAAVEQNKLPSTRWLAKALPMLRRVRRHTRSTENQRTQAVEILAMIEGKASPADIIARVFETEPERLTALRDMAPEQTAVTPVPIQSEIPATDAEPMPTEQFVKLFDTPAVEIAPANSGLLEEAKALAERERVPLHTDHVLRAMDARFPYAKKTETTRDLAELRNELSVYMELDQILSGAEDLSDPLKIAADHRIRLMQEVPDGPEPMWFRQLRLRCQIDLFFLGRAVCGKRFTNMLHRPLVEHLVLKNPKLPIEEQSATKDRLTMCFRGCFKSTASILDCVQWILCFPNDVRIVILTSTLKLAKRFIGELKQYFAKAKSARPTTFQALFPEFIVLPEEHGLATEFTVKNRRSGLKDPTAWAASVGSDDVGSHCDLLILDDAESADNSGTTEALEALNYKVSMARMLVDPGGYRQFIGTPYAPNDCYAQMRNSIEALKVFHKPVMSVKPEYSSKELRDLKEDEVVLAFPERVTWAVIKDAMRENIGVFQSQYMLNPSGESIPTFPIELLQSQTIKSCDIPVDANSTYAIWDLAYSIGPRSDSSVGVTASQAPDGRVYVREVIHDKFLPEDLALAIVDCYLRHRHKIVIIEASLGAENLRPTIERIARSQGVEHIPLFFLKTQTRRKNAKIGRIAALEPLLRSGRLFFSDDIACLSELYEQFSYFGSASHDDIPDAVALLFDSGYVSQQPYRLEGESLRRTRLIEDVMRDKHLYDRYFGPDHGDVPVPDQPVEPEWDNPPDDIYAVPGMPRIGGT
jgi:predicted phage terminase large subunit-like protein